MNNIINYIRENIDDQLNINSYIHHLPQDVIREFRDKIDWTDTKLLSFFDNHNKTLRNEFKKELRELREIEEKRVTEQLKFTTELIQNILDIS